MALNPEVWSALAQELVAPHTAIERRQEILQEVRSGYEQCGQQAFAAVLHRLIVPSIMQILHGLAPSATNDAVHILRRTCLDLLQKIKFDDAIKTQAVSLLRTLLQILRMDVEENGVPALRLFIDLLKPYKAEDGVYEATKSFVEYCRQVFGNMGGMLQFYLEEAGKWQQQKALGTFPSPSTANQDTEAQGNLLPTAFVPAWRSFKVAVECPFHFAVVLNLYGQGVMPLLQPLLADFTSAATIQDPANYPHCLSQVVTDFKLTRVKILSFLTYIMKSYAGASQQFVGSTVESLMYAIQTCPDMYQPRKDLIQAVRQLGITRLVQYLYPKLDYLLDETFILGSNPFVQQMLHEVATSMMVELLHHLRDGLTYVQMVRMLHLLCRFLVDPALSRSLQSTALRGLAGAVETMFARRGNLNEAEAYRRLIGRVMDCMCSKLVALQPEVEDLIEKIQAKKAQDSCGKLESPMGGKDEVKEEPCITGSQPLDAMASDQPDDEAPGHQGARDGDHESVKDDVQIKSEPAADAHAVKRSVKLSDMTNLHTEVPNEIDKSTQELSLLLRTTFQVMKSLLYSLLNYGNTRSMPPPLPGMAPIQQSFGLREEEIRALRPLITVGLPMLKLFGENSDTVPEEYDLFAEIFVNLQTQDGQDMAEVWAPNMSALVSAMEVDPKVHKVTAHLLENPSSHALFLDVLLTFLVAEKLPALREGPDDLGAKQVLRLFTVALTSLSKMAGTSVLPQGPDLRGERVLVYQIVPLLEGCLREIDKSPDPINCIRLLQTIARVLHHGKLAAVQDAIASSDLVLQLVDMLLRLYDGPATPPLRAAIIEMFLMLPVPIAAMAPWLPHIMPKLVLALKAGTELVHLALKVLESFLDKFEPDVLWAAAGKHTESLMLALWSHMKPFPYPYGPKVAQMVGKMGGQNRSFLPGPQVLTYSPIPDSGLKFIVTLSNNCLLLPMDRFLEIAIDALMDPSKAVEREGREQALSMLQLCASSLLNLRPMSDSGLATDDLGKMAEGLFANIPAPHTPRLPGLDTGYKTHLQLSAENKALTNIISTILATASDSSLASVALPFAQGVVRHFALLFASGVSKPLTVPPLAHVDHDQRQAAKTMMLRELDAHNFIQAVVEAAAADDVDRRKVVAQLFALFVDTLLMIHREQQRLGVYQTVRVGPEDTPSGSEGAKAQAEMLAKRTAAQRQLPVVLDEVVPRVCHACYGDTWALRMAGLTLIQVLLDKLPTDYLWQQSQLILHSILVTAARLPVHSIKDKGYAKELLVKLLSAVYPAKGDKEQAPGDDGAKGGNKRDDHPPQSGIGHDAEEGKDAPLQSLKSERDGSLTPGTLTGRGSILDRHCVLLARAAFLYRRCWMVQDIVMDALQIIGASTDLSASALLRPVLEQLKPSLEHKRLGSLNDVDALLANTAAITFAMRLEPPLLPVDASQQQPGPQDRPTRAPQDMVAHMCDAIELLEALDRNLPNQGISQTRTVLNQVSAQQLRAALTQLLVAFITATRCAASEGADEKPLSAVAELRAKIIQVFFKQLVMFSDPIVKDAAKQGIQVASKQNLKKKELHEGLNPILTALPKYEKLSLKLLSALTDLLELLQSWFNTTLGEKIIEHLHKWLSPETTLNVAEKGWLPGQELQLAQAMLNVFHLLPDAASTFLETRNLKEGRMHNGLVVLVTNLENNLPLLHSPSIVPPHVAAPPRRPTRLNSPYRPYLIKFLARHTVESVNYFLQPSRLCMSEYAEKLIDIICNPLGRPILEQISRSTAHLETLLLLQAPLPASDTATPQQMQQVATEARMHIIQLLAEMVHLLPEWLPEGVYRKLLQCWRAPERLVRIQQEADLPRAQLLESKNLAHCLINYVANHHDQISTLFEVLTIIDAKSVVDYTFVQRYSAITLPKTFSVSDKRQVLIAFTGMLSSGTQQFSCQTAVLAIKYVIRPMMEYAFANEKDEIVQGNALKDLMSALLTLLTTPSANASDAFNSEAMDIIDLMISKVPQQLEEYRSQIFEVIWVTLNHSKTETMAKYHAYVAMSSFLTRFCDTWDARAAEVFPSMIRNTTADHRRLLLRHALDAIVTAAALKDKEAGSAKIIPDWTVLMKDMLHTSPTSSLQQQLQIVQLIARHPDAFYPYRERLIPYMLQLMQRFGLNHGTNLEARRSALDVAVLLLKWETFPQKQAASKTMEEITHPNKDGSRKRQREGESRSSGSDAAEGNAEMEGTPPVAKSLKVEEGQSAHTAHATAASMHVDKSEGAAPGTGQPGGPELSVAAGEAARPAAHIEMTLRIVLRTLLMVVDNKDKELRLLRDPGFDVITTTLEMYPKIAVDMRFAGVILQQPAAGHSLNLGAVYVVEVFALLMKHQPEAVVTRHHAMVVTLLELVCTYGEKPAVDALVDIFQSFYKTYPLQTFNNMQPMTCPEAQAIQQRVQDKLQQILLHSTDPATSSITDPLTLRPLCCCLRLLEVVLAAGDSGSRYIQVLCRMSIRIAGENLKNTKILMSAAMHQRGQTLRSSQSRQQPIVEPEYSSAPWAFALMLRLCAAKALLATDTKKHFLQSVVFLISHNCRNVDAYIVVELLKIMQQWYLHPDSAVGILSAKEGLLLVQRVATLERMGAVEHLPDEAWDKYFLQTLYRLCTEEIGPHGQEIRAEVLKNVELKFLVGLRAKRKETRDKFFKLYDDMVPRQIFKRLQYILQDQDWEQVGNTFWIRNAVDMLLALVPASDILTLPLSHARIPVLQAATLPHLYSMDLRSPAGGGGSLLPSRTSSLAPGVFELRETPTAATSAAASLHGEGLPDGAAHTASTQQSPTLPGQQPVKQDGAVEQGGAVAVKVETSAGMHPRQSDSASTVTQVNPPHGHVVNGNLEGASHSQAPRGGGGGTGAADKGQDLKPEGPEAITSPDKCDANHVRELVQPQFNRQAELSSDIKDLLLQHASWLNKHGDPTAGALMSTLQELSGFCRMVGYHLWLILYQLAWMALEKNDQMMLAKPLIKLLEREYHIRQATHRPNVIQALLDAIHLTQPQPKMAPELLKFLGKTHNAWSTIRSLLETHVMLFEHSWGCVHSLCDLYAAMGEQDLLAGLWRRRSSYVETKYALSLMQQGYLQAAQDLFLQALNKQMNKLVTGGSLEVHKCELALWQQQYMALARELGQWQDMKQYAQQCDNHAMMLDSLALNMEWEPLREQVNLRARVEETPRTFIIQAQCTMAEASNYTLNDDLEKQVKNSIRQGFNEALKRWWQMPDLGLPIRVPLLAETQQLMEVIDSTKIISSLHDMTSNLMDVKERCEAWRTQVPCDWDSLGTWAEVSIWRNHIYNCIITRCSNTAQDHHLANMQQMGYRDKAWTVNQLSRICRHHGRPATALQLVNSQYGYGAMEVQEAFVKITEQAKAYRCQPQDLVAGLNFINNTAMEYFLPQHQAEVLRLKGTLLERMGEFTMANQSYSLAVTQYQSLAKGWSSWGYFCQRQAQRAAEAEAAQQAAAAQGAPSAANTHNVAADQYLRQAAMCYLQAIKQGSHHARAQVARLVALMTADGSGHIIALLKDAKNLNCVPAWMWLHWSTVLIASLTRPERSAARAILLRTGLAYPQALYFPLRYSLLSYRDLAKMAQDRRAKLAARQAAEAAQDAGKSASEAQVQEGQPGEGKPPPTAKAEIPAETPVPTPPVAPTPGSGAAADGPAGSAAASSASAATVEAGLASQGTGNQQQSAAPLPPSATIHVLFAQATQHMDAAKDVMDRVRALRTEACAVGENLAHEVSSHRFQPKSEERFLMVLNVILARCYRMHTLEVPAALRREIENICKQFLLEGPAGSRQGRQYSAATLPYMEAFARKYLNPATTPQDLGEVINTIKAWIQTLLAHIEDTIPVTQRLEDEGMLLGEQTLMGAELPGQYMRDCEITPDNVVYFEGLGSTVTVVRRHGYMYRRVNLKGSDGSDNMFLVQSSAAAFQPGNNEGGDERMLQMLRCFNRMLDRHPQCRKRRLRFHTPLIVPVWPMVRLLEDGPGTFTFLEAYEVHCTRHGRDTDIPIMTYRKRIISELAKPANERREVRLFAFREIEKRFSSDNAFTQFMTKTLPDANRLTQFKSQFCGQLGLVNLMIWLMRIAGRNPAKLVIDRSSGNCWITDYYGMYSDKMIQESQDVVPMRLTRNLSSFLGPFVVEGQLIANMAAAAQGLNAGQEELRTYLSLFFRDDLLMVHSRKQRLAAQQGAQGGTSVAPEVMKPLEGAQLSSYVRANVDKVMSRLARTAPHVTETFPPEPAALVNVHEALQLLVQQSQEPENLCRADPLWHPWY